jgi:hypothetical protein
MVVFAIWGMSSADFSGGSGDSLRINDQVIVASTVTADFGG